MNVVSTRMRAGSLLLALLLGFSFVAVVATPAHACSCAGMWDTEEEFRRSDAVFAGEVVEVEELPMEQAGPTDSGMPFLAPVTFDVKGAWKGVVGDSVVVHGQGPGPSCGLDFERGETYLVFAGRAGEGENGSLQTDMCSSTRQSSVETARNMFGPPAGTLPETGGPAPSAVGGILLAMVGLSACIACAVGIRSNRTRL
jgi:hypothetical protein